MSKVKPVVSSNAEILGGSVALSQPSSWILPYIYGKEDPQSSNPESEEPPQKEALPQGEALHHPQVKTSNLKHIFSIKYLISLKVINNYRVL